MKPGTPPWTRGIVRAPAEDGLPPKQENVMSNTNASLDVRDFPSNGSDGYIDTTASNNAIYSFRYTGGSDGHGGLRTKVGQGVATLNVRLESDSRYSIDDAEFDQDPERQLSWRGNSSVAGVITDANTAAETGHYSLIVADSQASCTFRCDPMVVNEPRDPPSRR